MTKTIPSAAARQWQAPSTILDMVINRRGEWAMVTLGDGAVATLTAADTGLGPQRLDDVHEGVSLSCCADAEDHAFLTAGDDGKAQLIDPELDYPTPLVETGASKWIDHVAASAQGNRAYAIGKTLYRLDEVGKELAPPFEMPSSIGDLAFALDGKRLAVAHKDGVHVFGANEPEKEPLHLEWEGLHTKLIWSPDGDTLLSAIQGGGVHGWRLGQGLEAPAKGNEMHMQGYEDKVTDFAFTAGGTHLVTNGSKQGVCWPFTDGGPWHKEPMLIGSPDDGMVTRVAPHPNDPMVALGYDDGMVALAPLDGRMEIMIHPPLSKQDCKVVGMVWNGEADTLLVAYEGGTILLFTLASVSRFVREQNKV